MSKQVNVDFVTRQIEVDTDGKEYYVSAAVAAKDAEQSMLNAQNAANEVKEIYGDGNFTPLSDLLGGLGTKLKRWGAIFANKVFASNLPIVYNSVAEMKADNKESKENIDKLKVDVERVKSDLEHVRTTTEETKSDLKELQKLHK